MMDSFYIDANPTLFPTPEGINHKATLSGFFEVEIWRKDKCIGHEFFNGITNEGLNNLLGVGFHGDTQQTTWYALLISVTSYSALSASDTMASHTGWTESVAYSESVRQTWTCGSPSSKSITNATEMTFTISVDGTVIKGIAICSDNTKSGNTGKLWSTGLFTTGDQTLLSGDLLKVKYTASVT